MMNQDRLWVLIARTFSGEASADDLKELEYLQKQHPEVRKYVRIISVWWNLTEEFGKDKAEDIFEKLLSRIEIHESNLRAEHYRRREPKKENKFIFTFSKEISMLKNYLKIGIRNLQKQKVFAFINIFGLSIGIACFSLLALYAVYEFSFDKFHKNAANIYRPYEWDRLNGGHDPIAYTDVSGTSAETLGESMKKNLPDLLDYVRLQLSTGENIFRTEKDIYRVNVTWTDPSFFSIFTFPLKYGDQAAALHNMNDIVLTESRAKQIFGRDNPIGKTVEIEIGTTFYPFTVSAVAKDVPANSTIQFDILGTFLFAQTNRSRFTIGNNWHPIIWQTYIQLRPRSKLAGDKQKLASFMETYDRGFIKSTNEYVTSMKKAGIEWNENELPVSLRLQPFLSIHTDTDFNSWGFADYAKIKPRVIWILMAIASGILLIACINFTTLAIGRSAGRSKEVGVRKIVGAGKHQVIFQFFTETLLHSIISTILGLLLAIFLLPWFNRLTGTELLFSFSLYPQMIVLLVGVAVIVGILAGSYPAFVLSNFKPLEVLKNKIRIGGSNLFTKSLVTSQFAMSIALIVSTIIILQQARYMIEKNPGFNKEDVVAIDASQTDPSNIFPLFKQAILKYPEIEGVTSAAAGLGAGQNFLGFSDQGLSADINIIDPDYIKVMGMRLIAGQNLRRPLFKDSISRIIINETMMNSFGWTPQNSVGKEIKNFQGGTAIVEGVVKNFNYRPLSEAIKNQVFETSTDKGYMNIYVRIKAGNPSRAIAAMQKEWNDLLPGIPLKYSFLDDDINSYYGSEQRWSNIVGWAGAISIFLACLGLLGLAALASVNRTKEIGIRKVLGASVSSVIALLSKDFLKLIVISFAIATPVAYYFMHRWLLDYAYRINISWRIFAIVGLGTILLALITIGFHAAKTAIASPVRSLRTE